MKYKIITLIFLFASFNFLLGGNNNLNKENNNMNSNIYDITVKDISGKDIKFSDYEGKVLLIVNVASKCGYTPQYAGLQELYTEYKDKGLEVLAFPCNDFGAQEPGNNKEIEEFCSTNYGVTFRLFDKIKVLGNNKSPLYERLINNPTTEQGDIKWNFEKFLISKEGEIVERFRSPVEPTSEKIVDAVQRELEK